MTTRRATDNAQALDAFMTTKFQIDAMLERLKALSDEHFNTHPNEINMGPCRHPEPLLWLPPVMQEVFDLADV